MAERNSYPREWTDRLPKEADRWVQGGLITTEQRTQIVALYPEPEAEGRDRTVLIFSILGSLLVGAGIILFFAANWPKIPAAIKVSAIMAAIIGSYASGYYLQVRTDYPRIGEALILLGGLLYGAGIWLIAQIFHLESHYPNGFFLWGLGVLPMAWAMGSRPMLYMGTALLTVWTVMEQAEFSSMNYLYPVLVAGVIFPLGRKLKTDLVEVAVLGGLFLWFAINVMRLREGSGVGPEAALLARIMLVYGGTVLAAGLARLGDERVYMGLGSLLALLGTYLLTFQWPVWMDGYRSGAPLAPLWSGHPFQLVGLTVLVAAMAASLWRYWQRGERGRLVMLPAVVMTLVLALGIHVLDEVPRMITANLLLFAATVGVILLAVGRQSQLLLNLGLLAFLVHVLTRYFDLFFTAMDKSFFFILGGLLLLGGGWLLERNRRRWMSDWGGDADAR